ncbi:MAG: type II toxin-antitoxin system death-on-curing family toxin [Fimbriimonadaceae bacterium]
MRDWKGLESAANQPQQGWGDERAYPTLLDAAAAYLFFICQAHAFLDGNKRAAVIAADLFLQKNGFELRNTSEEIEALTLGVASGKINLPELTALLRIGPLES